MTTDEAMAVLIADRLAGDQPLRAIYGTCDHEGGSCPVIVVVAVGEQADQLRETVVRDFDMDGTPRRLVAIHGDLDGAGAIEIEHIRGLDLNTPCLNLCGASAADPKDEAWTDCGEAGWLCPECAPR